MPASTLRKCALKLLIDTSAAVLWCVPGGTHSSCILYFPCIIFFGASDTPLSSMCFLGIIPTLHSLSIIDLYAHVSFSSLKFLMGSTSITLLSIYTFVMMYLLPHCEYVGNFPLWLERTVFLNLYMLLYTSRALCPCSVTVLGTIFLD